MAAQLVGHIKSIFRYPIKSMQGELLTSAKVTPLGIEGDRSYALRIVNGKNCICKANNQATLI